MLGLESLGFSEQWQKESIACSQPEQGPARVIAVDRKTYTIGNESGEIPAELTGKMMHSIESKLELPTVGDWVCAEYFDQNTFAVIHRLLSRKSLLKRKAAGQKIEYQLIAANIDIAFIVQSLDSDFNLRRLERYMAMIQESDIEPVILLSKSDLVSAEQLDDMIKNLKDINPERRFIAFSSLSGDGLCDIENMITKGNTYCLIGSSGVGKTTLLNKLIGEDTYATGAVRVKDCKGRHVTARRQLIVLERGGIIIDTPGMRELGNIGIDTGLEATFDDIAALAANCRFRDCTHIDEPDCAVIEAVKIGMLDGKRYESYLKLKKESEFHKLSYTEKRKKDKQFGKFIKKAKKDFGIND